MAMVVTLAVTGAIYKLLTTSQRLSHAQAARTDLQSNERAASLIVPNELRELNTVVGGSDAENDIIDMQTTSIEYRAMRGLGFVCQATVGQIRFWQGTWSARVRSGQVFSGTWQAAVKESEARSLGELLQQTLERQITGSWRSQGLAGNWWLRADGR